MNEQSEDTDKVDRDGAIDIVFPVCSHHSTSSGIGTDCSIHVAYNKQAPLCSGEGTVLDKDGGLKCRGWGELCVADPGFNFSFAPNDPVSTKCLSNLRPGSNRVDDPYS